MRNSKSELRSELNKEWAKPKAKNLKRSKQTEARDYDKIDNIQVEINSL